MSYTIAQNTSFMTAASVLQKAVSFVYFIVIARLIGAENTGIYFFALTFSTIFLVFADFGLSNILTRESAKFQEQSADYLNTILSVKLILGLAAYVLMAIVVNALGYPDFTKLLIYLAGITIFFDNLHSAFYAFFRGKNNLIYEASGLIVFQIITLAVGSLALYNHWSLIWLIFAYTIPSGLNVIYCYLLATKRFQVRINFVWNQTLIKSLLILSWPLFVAALVGRLYAYSDSLMMSKLLTPMELGWWGVAYKVVFAFQFIPIALAASAYPAFSALFVSNREELVKLFIKSWRYLFTIVFPLAVGIIVLAKPAIITFYSSSYAASVAPLRILAVSLIFIFLAFITGSLLNACNRQRTQTALMIVVLTVSVILNWLVLPRYGIIGSAWVSLFCNFGLLSAGYIFCSRVITLKHWVVIKYAAQTLVPAVIMGALVYWLMGQMNFLFTIPLGGLAYLILLFVSGGIDRRLVNRVITKITNKSSAI